jgi:hypothetical protein
MTAVPARLALGLALGVALGGGAAGCTASRTAAAAVTPAIAPLPFPALKPFFVVGETITWNVTMAGIHGARARLAVGESTDGDDGRKLLVLRAEAESAGIATLIKEVRSSMASWIDADSGVPARSQSDSFGIGNTLVVHAERTRDEGGDPMAEFRIARRAGADVQEKRQRLPVFETHDPLSATLVLRAWNAPKGTRALLYSLGGVRMWKTVLTVEGHEELKTALGKRKTVRIGGVSTRLRPSFEEDTRKPPRTFTLWVTDDDQRIPVKIAARTELGEVVANATSYEAPE